MCCCAQITANFAWAFLLLEDFANRSIDTINVDDNLNSLEIWHLPTGCLQNLWMPFNCISFVFTSNCCVIVNNAFAMWHESCVIATKDDKKFPISLFEMLRVLINPTLIPFPLLLHFSGPGRVRKEPIWCGISSFRQNQCSCWSYRLGGTS